MLRKLLAWAPLALFGLALAAAAASPPAPADARLSPRGCAILGYFQQLAASPELRLVSGQFCGYGPGASLEAAAKISRAGGLVAASTHLNNPARAEGGGWRDKGVRLADLLVEGTPVHERWLRQLDDLAAGLQELQRAGVVVLWRPLHEMNGGWFWWGAQDPAVFIRVWRHMFAYFTQTKGLHNLLWVYSPNKGAHPAEYYPGDHYADLVGLDVYTDFVDPAHVKGYDEVAGLAKPFGFTEFGPHGSGDPPGDFDFRRFTAGVAEHFPRTRFFLNWDVKWNPAENKFAREFYTDPRVITRADLPAGLAGDAASAVR